jgi:glycosyltransferase involved in cell wall biosynthesis
VIICGLANQSRTETFEEYYKDKVDDLVVIVQSVHYLKIDNSECRIYHKGRLTTVIKLSRYYAPHMNFKVVLTFISYFFNILRMARRTRSVQRYLGISNAFALYGVILKKFWLVNYVIDYTIDYYLPNPCGGFINIFIWITNALDRFIISNSDEIWEISSRITEKRKSLGMNYKSKLVPLSYSNKFRVRSETYDLFRLGFVGSIGENQGLQLVVDCLPDLVAIFPKIHLDIIGTGMYRDKLMKQVEVLRLKDFVTFHGFIKDDAEMLKILTKCSIGLAMYSREGNNTVDYADTGKSKLYSVCGLPVLGTAYLANAQDIVDNKAGCIISYAKKTPFFSLRFMLSNPEILDEYRDNSYRLGERYLTENVMKEVS